MRHTARPSTAPLNPRPLEPHRSMAALRKTGGHEKAIPRETSRQHSHSTPPFDSTKPPLQRGIPPLFGNHTPAQRDGQADFHTLSGAVKQSFRLPWERRRRSLLLTRISLLSALWHPFRVRKMFVTAGKPGRCPGLEKGTPSGCGRLKACHSRARPNGPGSLIKKNILHPEGVPQGGRHDRIG